MTTEHQPEALQLADRLEREMYVNGKGVRAKTATEAAAELRRLQAENDALRAQVEALSKPQEPVQWQKRHQEQTEGLWENTTHHDAKWWEGNSTGWEIRALYAHPTPAPTRPAVPEDFLESPDIADEDSLLNTYYSRELVLECIAAAMLAAAPQAEAPTQPAVPASEAQAVVAGMFKRCRDVMGSDWPAAPATTRPAVPEGWKLVPVEPTVQMCIAGHREGADEITPVGPIYRAMLAAAPQAEAQKGGE